MFPLERDPALDSFHPRENRVVSFPRPSPDEKKRMERGRSGLDPLKGDRSIIVISSVDNNGHWPLGEAALLPLLPPSPIHLPLILERIDRASRILGFQGWFTGPLSLPTLRIVDFVPVESGIAYLLELSILRNSTPSCRIIMGEVSKSSFDRIKFEFSFVFSSSLENFSSIKFHATAAISNLRRFLPLDSTRGAESDVDRTRREKKKNSKSVEKASSSPRRRSKSCASLEEVARSEGEGGEGKDGGKR